MWLKLEYNFAHKIRMENFGTVKEVLKEGNLGNEL